MTLREIIDGEDQYVSETMAMLQALPATPFLDWPLWVSIPALVIGAVIAWNVIISIASWIDQRATAAGLGTFADEQAGKEPFGCLEIFGWTAFISLCMGAISVAGVAAVKFYESKQEFLIALASLFGLLIVLGALVLIWCRGRRLRIDEENRTNDQK